MARFSTFFCSDASILVLLAIAVDRYRKVCQPFKSQLGLHGVKLLLLPIFVTSFAIAFPSTLLYDVHPVVVVTGSGVMRSEVNGTACEMSGTVAPKVR